MCFDRDLWVPSLALKVLLVQCMFRFLVFLSDFGFVYNVFCQTFVLQGALFIGSAAASFDIMGRRGC